MPPVRAPVATLLLLSLLTFVVGLGRQAISDGDEGFYAEASREMVESGDWLTPHFNYVDRWQKPVLYYWVTAATFAVTGTSDWGARAFSAASGVALVFLTWAIGLRMFPDRRVAWIGAAMAATCYGYFAMARLALPDLPLALFITLTIHCWLAERPLLAGLAAGLGFLDKGPLALLVPGIVLLPLAWRERRWPSSGLRPVSLAPRALGLAALIAAAVSLPWYASMVATHGTAYLESFFLADNLERFATDRFNAPRAYWFYVPILVGGLFPWTMFLLVLPWRRARALLQRKSPLSGVEWRLVLWALIPFLFFTASIGKQPRYILPVLPPVALLLASALAARTDGTRTSPASRRELSVATGLTAMVFAALGVLLYRAGPILINAYPSMTLLGVGVLWAAALLLIWTTLQGAWSTLPWRMAVCGALVLLTMQFGALAGRRPEAVESVAATVLASRDTTTRVGTLRVLERNLGFYTGLPLVQVFDDRQAADFLQSDERVILVGRDTDLLRLQQSLSFPLKALGSVDYIDPASIRLSTLLSPLPRRDVSTLMVISNR
jgi:4-amino-4-deoxy-L-arabinose transferase-like glycosyltransferase